MKRLEEKIIIITGGSGLLGRHFISNAIEEGAIAVNFDVSFETDISKNEIYCDITSQESIDQAIKIVIDQYGKIDGLVNNAYPRTKDWGTSFDEIKYSSWKENVDMQMNSYFYITQKVSSLMKEKNYGSIVNITSIYGIVGNDFTIYEGTDLNPPAAYAAIKGGLINFSRYLASFYGKDNIRVNCVSPGGIFDNQPKQFVTNYENKVPLKRLGLPEDISPSVIFLLSDEAKYITGHNLVVDGGWTAI